MLNKKTMCHGHLVFSDDELTDKELKQIEADDQAIQTILLGLPEDIYAAVDSCETAQEIWLRVQQMMKVSVVKNKRENDKIGTKPDKNGKRGENRKSQEQSQWIKREKPNKTKKEWSKTQTRSKSY
nr:ribonuclease H-like domain-containing protein [Tanacetum cinerariifolium]